MAETNFLVCDSNCWRYLSDQEKPEYKRHTCYVGSSEGALVGLGQKCTWDFLLNSGVDRGSKRDKKSEDEQRSAKVTEVQKKSKISLEVATRNSRSVYDFFHGLIKPSQPICSSRNS